MTILAIITYKIFLKETDLTFDQFLLRQGEPGTSQYKHVTYRFCQSKALGRCQHSDFQTQNMSQFNMTVDNILASERKKIQIQIGICTLMLPSKNLENMQVAQLKPTSTDIASFYQWEMSWKKVMEPRLDWTDYVHIP